jgi:uncharacterized protein YkwD
MRAFSLFAVLLCAPVALAIEVPDAAKPATATTEVAKPAAAKTETPKPDAAKTDAEKAAAAKKVPLHEHPTLLQMLKRNNELRQGVGLLSQRMSPELTQAAQYHANYMARTGDFNHYSNLGPWGRARRFLYRGNVRENIAMGQRGVGGAFVAWRNSGGHWASIVSNTEDAGFGYAVSQNGTPYWVGMYGNPDKTEAPKPTADELAANDAQPPAPPADVAAPGENAIDSGDDNSSGNYYNNGRRHLLRFRR